MLITGIETVVTRGDAVDRSLIVELAPILEKDRRTEASIWTEFETVHASILGALLDAVSTALRNEATTHLTDAPRLADFATWVEAGAPAFGWAPDAFQDAYRANRSGADELALDALPVGAVLREFMQERAPEPWIGTATELLTALKDRAGDIALDRAWPKKPQTLVNHLKRLAPHLRRLGITVEKDREPGGKRRTITITYLEPSREAKEASQASQRHTTGHGLKNSVTLDQQDASRSGRQASQTAFDASQSTSENPQRGAEKHEACDARDACDASSAATGGGELPLANEVAPRPETIRVRVA